jgi:protein-disulfide isomerase
MRYVRLWVILALILGVVVFIGLWSRAVPVSWLSRQGDLPSGLPTFGSEHATLDLLLFEDFFCQHCLDFEEAVLPDIMEQYVDSKRASLTVVPLGFLRSTLLAETALAVYHQDPSKFFPVSHLLFHEKPSDIHEVLLLAEKIGGIDLNRLRADLETHVELSKVKEGYLLAKEKMPKKVLVPALYLNGKPIPTASLEAVDKALQSSYTTR